MAAAHHTWPIGGASCSNCSGWRARRHCCTPLTLTCCRLPAPCTGEPTEKEEDVHQWHISGLVMLLSLFDICCVATCGDVLPVIQLI
jgi:hypothetical protein